MMWNLSISVDAFVGCMNLFAFLENIEKRVVTLHVIVVAAARSAVFKFIANCVVESINTIAMCVCILLSAQITFLCGHSMKLVARNQKVFSSFFGTGLVRDVAGAMMVLEFLRKESTGGDPINGQYVFDLKQKVRTRRSFGLHCEAHLAATTAVAHYVSNGFVFSFYTIKLLCPAIIHVCTVIAWFIDNGCVLVECKFLYDFFCSRVIDDAIVLRLVAIEAFLVVPLLEFGMFVSVLLCDFCIPCIKCI